MTRATPTACGVHELGPDGIGGGACPACRALHADIRAAGRDELADKRRRARESASRRGKAPVFVGRMPPSERSTSLRGKDGQRV